MHVLNLYTTTVNFDFLASLTTQHLVVLISFALFFIIQLTYYTTLFSRIAFYKKNNKSLTNNEAQKGVSVVICVRNESERLKEILPCILEQNCLKYEVIVVNNCSTDDSEDVLNLLKIDYPNLVSRTIELDKIFAHNNSMAWGVGFKAAKYDWIVLTDINCYPQNNNWLSSLQKNFNDNTEVVLSYTDITQNKLLRADNFLNALYYLSKARAKKPYMGTGTNLAFHKSLFFNNRGFHAQLKLYDKADSIFINSIVTAKNTVVDLSSDTINKSSLKISFKEWRLKCRDEYHSRRLFRAGTRYTGCAEMVTRVIFYVMFVIAFIYSLPIQWAWIMVLSMFGMRLIIQILIFAKVQKRLKEKGILFASLFWDIISPIVYLPIIMLSKKGRG